MHTAILVLITTFVLIICWSHYEIFNSYFQRTCDMSNVCLLKVKYTNCSIKYQLKLCFLTDI